MPVLAHAVKLCRAEVAEDCADFVTKMSHDAQPVTIREEHRCAHHSDSQPLKTEGLLSNDPSLPVSHRARVSPYPMIPYKEAYNTVISNCKPGVEVQIKVDELAQGMVISRDVYALESVPAYPASVVDGYAVIRTYF